RRAARSDRADADCSTTPAESTRRPGGAARRRASDADRREGPPSRTARDPRRTARWTSRRRADRRRPFPLRAIGATAPTTEGRLPSETRGEHRVSDLRPDDRVRRDDDVAVDAMAGPRSVAGAGAGGGKPGRVETPELAPLDELIAGRDLLQHARRGIAGAQEIESEMTEARVGARLGDDGANPWRHVNAPRADGHLVGRNRDAEHAG